MLLGHIEKPKLNWSYHLQVMSQSKKKISSGCISSKGWKAGQAKSAGIAEWSRWWWQWRQMKLSYSMLPLPQYALSSNLHMTPNCRDQSIHWSPEGPGQARGMGNSWNGARTNAKSCPQDGRFSGSDTVWGLMVWEQFWGKSPGDSGV